MIDAYIPDGSMALIQRSDVPKDGVIQAVRVDGRVALKRMREGEDHIRTLCYEDGSGRTIPLGGRQPGAGGLCGSAAAVRGAGDAGGVKMRRAAAVLIAGLPAGTGRAEDFRLPKIKKYIDSFQTAFRSLLDNTAGMGFIDYDSSWPFGDQTGRYKNYLDSVLENMPYGKVRAYAEEPDTAVKQFDWMNVSRNRQIEFEEFMSAGRGNSVFTWELPPGIRDFNTWTGFFKNENNTVRDWLVKQKNKEGLYDMLNEIQQRYYTEYKIKLDVFCAGWGI
jgi:hypothetical protein